MFWTLLWTGLAAKHILATQEIAYLKRQKKEKNQDQFKSMPYFKCFGVCLADRQYFPFALTFLNCQTITFMEKTSTRKYIKKRLWQKCQNAVHCGDKGIHLWTKYTEKCLQMETECAKTEGEGKTFVENGWLFNLFVGHTLLLDFWTAVLFSKCVLFGSGFT